jgi:putative ABC transport system permease protein
LLVAQATFSVILLFGTGMFVRSLQNVNRIPLGIDIDKIALVSADLTAAGYATGDIAPVFDALATLARRMPQIANASVSVAVPLSSNIGIGLRVPGRDSVPRSTDGAAPYFDAVDADYFATMGVAIVRGRAFTNADVLTGAPVTIVNEEMARRTWPGEEAVGKCLQIGGDERPCSAVVGVARNTRRQALFEEAVPLQFYSPLGTEGASHRNKRTLFVRMRVNDAAMRNAVRTTLQAAIPNLPFVSVSPMRDLLSADVRAWEMGTTMFAAFGVAALFLVAIGWYASLGYEVDQRRREVGIRLALGALPGSVLRSFVWRGAYIALIGLAVGIGVVTMSLRWVQEFLYQVSPANPVVCMAVAGTLVLTTVVATFLPARRAALTDAASTLRNE